MAATRPAAGGKRGGGGPKPTPGNPSPTTSRAAKNQRAKAYGRTGQPVPEWVDTADALDAYGQGREHYLRTAVISEDDEPPPPTPLTQADALAGNNNGPQSAWGMKSRGPVRPTGAAGDAAGLLLGFVAAAFLINAVKGTWTDWLRAKFLNQVTGSTWHVLPGGGGVQAPYDSQGHLQNKPDPNSPAPFNPHDPGST